MHTRLLILLSLSVLSVVEGQMRCDGGQKCGADAPCCSQYGYCGTSSEHCSAGCNPNLSFRPQSCTNFQGSSYPRPDENSYIFTCNANVRCPSHQPCCSRFGYCGTSSEHCTSGCNSIASFSPWSCSNNENSNPSAQCSANSKCPDYAPCCSRFGYCGSSPEHCSNGCNVLGSWNPFVCQDFRPVPIYPQPVYPPIHIPISIPINRPRPHYHPHRPPSYPDLIPVRPIPNIRPPFREPEIHSTLTPSNGDVIGDGSGTATNQQISISPPFTGSDGSLSINPPLSSIGDNSSGSDPNLNQLVLPSQNPNISGKPSIVNVNGGSGSSINTSLDGSSSNQVQVDLGSGIESNRLPNIELGTKLKPNGLDINERAINSNELKSKLVNLESRSDMKMSTPPFISSNDKPWDNVKQLQGFNDNRTPMNEVPKASIFDTNVGTNSDKIQSSKIEKEAGTEVLNREACQPHHVDFDSVVSTDDLPFTTDAPVSQGMGLKFMPNVILKANTNYQEGIFIFDLNLTGNHGVQVDFLPNDDRLPPKFVITLDKSKIQVLLDNQEKVVELEENGTNQKLQVTWLDASLNIFVNETSVAKFAKLSSLNFPTNGVTFAMQPTARLKATTAATADNDESFYLKSFHYKCSI